MTYSAMFLAWSPIRSIALATHSVSSADEMVRGSSIMNVISVRMIERNSWSTETSWAISASACLPSRRANESSASCSMSDVCSAIWRTA
jgi:hypothetical protein